MTEERPGKKECGGKRSATGEIESWREEITRARACVCVKIERRRVRGRGKGGGGVGERERGREFHN